MGPVALSTPAATFCPRPALYRRGRPPAPLAALCGAIAAPLSYVAGARLGALNIDLARLPLLALAWALLLPLAFHLSQRLLHTPTANVETAT